MTRSEVFSGPMVNVGRSGLLGQEFEFHPPCVIVKRIGGLRWRAVGSSLPIERPM